MTGNLPELLFGQLFDGMISKKTSKKHGDYYFHDAYKMKASI